MPGHGSKRHNATPPRWSIFRSTGGLACALPEGHQMPQLSRLDPLFGPGHSLVNRRDVLRVGSVSVAATLVPSAMMNAAKADGSH